MQNSEWIELFHLIPAEQQGILMITTVSGIDLNIEMILRTEPSVLVFRGRVVGSTDADGRVFFLPYKQIDFVYMNRFVRENEVQEMFEKAIAARPAAKPAPASDGVYGSTSHNSAIYSSTGDSPPAVPLSTAAPVTRLSPSHYQRLQTAPVVAATSPPNDEPAADAPAPPRSSILERLRAQRNAVLPPQPPTR